MKTRCSCLLFRHRGFFGLRTCRKVKLDLPFTVQDEARAERFAGLRTEAGKHFGRTSIFDQLARDLRRDRAARDSLPDHVAAARLLAALPARAAVGARVLLDDLARLGAAARARAELDALGAELLLVEGGDLLDGLRRQVDDALDELLAVAAPVLDVREPLLPVAGQLGRGERVLLEHRDHLQALRCRLEFLAGTLDVLPTDQDLDRLGTRRRGAEP